MKARNTFLLACIVIFLSTTNAWALNTGQFQLPFDQSKSWTCDSRLGYTKDEPYGQPHFNYGGVVADAYHPGEDWNGWCNDLGDSLYAIADGEVSFVNYVGSGGGGKSVHIIYDLPDAKQVKSIYFHLSEIERGIVVGGTVKKGQLVAKIGNTGLGSTGPHLHWEMNTDIYAGGAGYVSSSDLTPAKALKYPFPTLFVSDRMNLTTYIGNRGQWMMFQFFGNAPSSIAYVEYRGIRVSLQLAIVLGWISSHGIPEWYGSGWGFSPVSQLFFFDTNWYLWMPLLDGVSLNILRPLNTPDNQADRAKADMIREASKEPRFVSVKTETYLGPNDYAGWGGDVAELHSMDFGLAGGGTWRMYQMTTKQNPLSRLVIYPNLDTGQFENWTNMDQNTLY